MKILAVGAHPDDLEFVMAGTLLKLVDEGHEVVGLVLTEGEAGTYGTAEDRRKEMKDAADFIGYALERGDFSDAKIMDSVEARLKVANIIRRHCPDVVFAPYHTNHFSHKDGAAHPDHTAAGTIVRNALRLAKFRKVETENSAHMVNHIVYYMVPKGRAPTFVCDVSRYSERILAAMKMHSSQLMPELSERLVLMRKWYGMMIGAELGEAFIIDDPVGFDIAVFNPSS